MMNQYNYPQFSGHNPFASQAKMLFHGERIVQYLQSGDCRPIFCEVNLTNKCNLRCKWCISANFSGVGEEIQTKPFLKFVAEFVEYGGKAITFSGGGEPTIHSNFEEILVATGKFLPNEIGLMTNGAFSSSLCKSIAHQCRWIRISLDTLDEEHYFQWKKSVRLPQVKQNIFDILSYNTNVRVGLNCNVHPELSIKEVDELVGFLDKTSLNYLQFRPIIPRYYKQEKFTYNQEVWDHIFALSHPRINTSTDKFLDLTTGNVFPYPSCFGHVVSFVVDCDGNICVCMYHPNDDRFVFGNIYSQTFSEIWRSPKRQDVVKFVTQNLDVKNECQVCCKLCELNKLFYFLNNAKQTMDINFL